MADIKEVGGAVGGTSVIDDGKDPAALIEDSAGLDFLEIDTSGEVVIIGGGGAKLGVGGTPTSMLHVHGGNASVASFLRTGYSGTTEIRSGDGISTIQVGESFALNTDGGTEAFRIDTDQKISTGGEETPLCEAGGIHIYTGDSTQAAIYGGADDLILEGNDDVGITFCTVASKTAGLYFNKGNGTASNYIRFAGASEKFEFKANTAGDFFTLDGSKGALGVNNTSPTAIVDIRGNLTTNLSDSSNTCSGTGDRDVESTAHGLVAGAAVKDAAGNKYTVASVTNADNFVIDEDAAGSGDQGQWTTDPSFLKILTGDTGTPATALEFTNRRQLILADAASNICIGTSTTGDSLTAGSNNVFVGLNAGTSVLNGNQNSVFGNQACRQGKTDNTQTTAIGYYALYEGGGGYNTAVGAHALEAANSSGSNNVAVGRQAGDTIVNGDQNTCLGTGADATGVNAQNQIAIGYTAVSTADNQIMMGNHRSTDMTMDCPPITIKQTSTSGLDFKIEHEGSAAQLVGLGEDSDAGWLQLQDSAGVVVMKVLKSGSSHILNGTSTNFGIGDPSPNSNFTTIGHQSHLCTAGGSIITGGHDVGVHSTLLYDTSGTAITATLPAVSGLLGRVYTFKLVTAGNNLVIDANGSETIDGAANYTTSVAKTAVTIQCDGVGWQIISEYTP